MNIQKYLIYFFGCAAVIAPVALRLRAIPWDSNNITASAFPLLGIIAFSLLWLHALMGVFESWLKKHIAFDQIVHWTSIIILLCIIFHPALLLVNYKFNIYAIYSTYDNFYLWLGVIGFFLLLTYDVGKALKKHQFFEKNWQNILTISTVGFLLIFFHSLNLGSGMQTEPLRSLWIFYGTTAIIATVYTYGIKRFIINKKVSRKAQQP